MKKSFLIFFGILVTLSLGAIKFTDNDLKLGDATNTDKSIVFDKGSGVANPQIKYESSTSELQFTNNGTDFSAIGTGGTGEISVIGNPSNATNWTASGAGITVATTSTVSDLPLGDVVKTAIKLTPVSGTDYAQYCWTQPASLKNRKLKASWEQRPLSGYASGDLKFDVYTYATASCGGAAARVALSTDVSAVTGIPNSTQPFTTTFDADSSDYYGIRYTRVAGTTALNIASVTVGPGSRLQGAVIGEWASFTLGNPTNTTTPTTKTAVYRRVGSSIEIKAAFQFGGVATSAVRFALASIVPNGLTVNTAALVDTVTGNSSVGHFSFTDASAGSTANDFTGTTNWANGSTELRFITTGDDEMDATSPVTITSGDLVTFEVKLPISEWAGNGTVNLAQNDVEYAYNTNVSDAADTTSFGYGPAGTPFPGSTFTAARNKTVRFQTPISSTDVITLEIQPLGAGPDGWVPLVGDGTAAATNIQGLKLQNATYYGAGIHSIASSTDVIVRLGQYAYASGATYAAAGSNWDTTSDNFRWRLKKSSGGIAVGFGTATSTASGLIPSYVKGTCTPNWVGPGTSGGTQLCSYVKIGSEVCIESTWTNFTTDGVDTVTGTLPFAAKTASTWPIVVTNAGTVQMGRFITTAASTSGAPTSSLTSTAFTGVAANNTLNVNFCYEVNE